MTGRFVLPRNILGMEFEDGVRLLVLRLLGEEVELRVELPSEREGAVSTERRIAKAPCS